VSHKGTLVLVAVASKAKCEGIGIDLERHLPRELRAITADVVPEGLPSGVPSDVAMTIAFSAKEAAFKAQFALTGSRLQFTDVELEWGLPVLSHYRMSARIGDLRLAIDAKLVDTKWVVSSAQVVAKQ
jgi:4'-phosphopantetheinyl transferase EntD